MPWKPQHPDDFPTLGYAALDWITENLGAPDRMDYEPFYPTQEQADFILRFYEINPKTGKRKIRRGVLSRARGWGKSPFISALAILEGLGDVLPDGWDAEGQPVGRPWSTVRMPLIVVAAASETQTQNAWLPLLEMLREDAPVWDNYPGLETMGTRVNLPYGMIQPITASPTASKGFRPIFTIMDQALAVDTPIPTPTGWTTMGELRRGDLVIGRQGQPVVVTEAKPVSTEHVCYRVTFRDGSSVVASAGHLWEAKTYPRQKPRVMTTEEIAGAPRCWIPAAPVRYGHRADLPVDPYLLGFWLGDGTRGKAEVTIGERDLEASLVNLAAVGAECSVRRYAERAPSVSLSRRGGYQCSGRPAYVRALQGLACYRDKSKPVPDEYLTASIDQRTELLRGLMDTDGSITNGVATFVTVERTLAQLVVDLLRGLGQWVHDPVFERDARYQGGGKYRVRFTPRRGLQPFKLPRKAAKVRPGRSDDWISVQSVEKVDAVPVRCIAVDADDHLFSFGRAGHMTHNTEQWTRGNGGIEFARVLKANATKIGGSIIETPNAYEPGRDSVAENSAKAYFAMREGRAKMEEGLLYDHREAPPDTNLGERESLEWGLRVAYGDSSDHPDGCVLHDPPCPPGWAPIETQIAHIWDEDADEQESRGDFLNQITNATDAWLSQPEWAARKDQGKRIEPGDTITLGFDGARGARVKGKPDATALVGCRVSDGHVFQVGVWEAPDQKETWPDWTPSIVEIEAALGEMFSHYRVAAFYADPAYFTSYVGAWEAKYGAKVQVRVKRDHPFEWWMTGGRSVAVEKAVEQVEEAVRNGDMTHDGSWALTRHVLNARRRLSHGRLALGKDHPSSHRKIDAALAMVLAWQARLDCVAAGVGVARRPTVPRRIR